MAILMQVILTIGTQFLFQLFNYAEIACNVVP